MANVTIDGACGEATARGMRALVWHPTDPNIGYAFFIDDDFDFSYSKTTNGGVSWGAAVQLGPNDTDIAYGVWADWWTPGDSGTLIHCAWVGTSLDDVIYRTLDMSGDTLGTQRTAFTGSTAVADPGNTISITKSRSGYLYIAYDMDAGAERGLLLSTNGGVNWSEISTTFIEATDDFALMLPATNTGDDNDVWAVYMDASANAITLKLWDSSAGSASESATIAAYIDNTTDLINQHGFAASVRHSDGHIILAVVTERDTATSDHRVFDITSTSTWSELTAITTDIDDHYYPSVFIDQNTADIYVAYNGNTSGAETLGTSTHIYYRKSSNGGSSWDAQVQYSEDSGNEKFQTWTPLMGSRFFVSWHVDSPTLGNAVIGNAVNSLNLSSAAAGIPHLVMAPMRPPRRWAA